MAEKDGNSNFWWTLIKAGAAITLIDHMFPTEEHQVTEYEKLSIEKKQKISDLKSVISKYNEIPPNRWYFYIEKSLLMIFVFLSNFSNFSN